MKEEINIIDIAIMTLKWWWIIAIATVLCTVGMYFYSSHFVAPLYESKGSFYVSSLTNETDKLTYAIQEANSRFSETYIELLTSDNVLNQVSNKLAKQGYEDMSAGRLRSMISLSMKNETEVLELRVRATDPYTAQDVTNAVLNVAPIEIAKIVKTGRTEIVDEATIATSPSYPNIPKMTLMGTLIGLVLSAAVIVMLELFDSRIKPENNLESMYGYPVLGNISEIN